VTLVGGRLMEERPLPEPDEPPGHGFEQVRRDLCGHELFRLENGYVVRCGRRLLEHEARMYPKGEIQPREARDPS
jgi:hypothetical protein